MTKPRTIRRALCALLATAVFLAGLGGAVAAKQNINTEVFDQDGYLRLVFDWPDKPRATAEIENGVLVIYFEDAFTTDIKYLKQKLKPYVSRIRQDKEKHTLRLALRGELKLLTAVVDNQLALDLLPLYWKGSPPPFYGTAPDLEAVEQMIAGLRGESAERSKIASFDPAAPYLALDVRSGEHSEFTRVVFEWPYHVDYELTESEGLVALSFAANARPKLTRFRVDPPRHVLGADYKNKQKTLLVDLQISPDVDVKHFRDANSIAVDLWPKKAPATDASQAIAANDTETDEAFPELDKGVPQVVDSAAVAAAPVEEKVVPEPKLEEAAPRRSLAADEDWATNDADFHMSPPPEKLPQAKPDIDTAEIVEPFVPVVKKKPAAGDAAFKVDVVSHAKQTRLRFPWPYEVEAAVFHRADHLWVVFSEEANLDLSAIDRRVRQHIVDAQQLEIPQATVLRLRVPEGVQTFVDAQGKDWIVTVGEEERPPRGGISLESFSATRSDTKVKLALGKPATVYWVRDPEIGDDIAVVTAAPEIRSIPATRKYVDFALLETAHGVVVQSAVDDLFVGLDPDGNVLVRSSSGLSLSTPDRTAWGTGESILRFISRPAFVDVEEWKTELDFATRRHELQLAVSVADGPELEAARFDLARFYIAHQLPTEALGIISLIVQENPTSENAATVRALRGIASLLLGRVEEAVEDLDHRLLENDRDAGLWQGLAAHQIGKADEAAAHFDRARQVFYEYPVSWQKRFALAAANAQLERNEVEEARQYLSILPVPDSGRIEDPEVQWVHARALERAGQTDAAIELFEEAARSSHLPTAIRAQFDTVRLLTKVGSMSSDEAIDRLDGLRFQWRGDALELAILSELGNLMIAQNRYRDGLGVLQTAVTHYPNENFSRQVMDDMAAAFANLYLEGEADKLPPIQALALFYDYRELTPIGRRGDQMIRRLADRLADVDLLEQSANLLSHQVENRLHGVAKAQVAARLAMVYLLDRKPEAALAAIRNTRQGRLPAMLVDQRRLLEARALADLHFGEKAMDLLTEDNSLEARRLKADISWQMGEMKMAAKAYEKLLGARWRDQDLLSAGERLDVMRAAIGYSLAGDDFALSRIRERYLATMSASEDASSFEIVTKGIDRTGEKFSELVKNIANTSTLDAFIEDVRRRYDTQTLSALN